MKYLIFDLDDTLLMSNELISDYTKQVLKDMQAKGHILVINTARNLARTLTCMEMINADYAILNGGSLIADRHGAIIYQDGISIETTNQVVVELLAKCKEISVDSDYFYCSSESYAKQTYTSGSRYFDFSVPFNKISYKILASTYNMEEVEIIAKKYHLGVTNYVGSEWNRLYKLGVSKWTGIQWLVNHLDGKISDTITFGDDVGDLEMLENAGLGVAMANSQPRVLAKIKVVTPYTSNEDGVARYLVETLGL